MSSELCTFGYTDREAKFLALAVLQSGYFLRRQFNAYIDRKCGALGQQFINRAIRLGHIRALPGSARQQLYHVGARAVYDHIGEPHNRNRRLHAPETVRQRLMLLDYVLARPGENWLLRREARRDAVAGVCPLSLAVSGTVIGQVLADTQPISRDKSGTLSFAFIDASFRSYSEWERFLKRRRPLLHTDGVAAVVYATANPGRLRQAEKIFRRMTGEDTDPGGIDRERLQNYFVMRRLFEERRFDSFDKARLDRLREDQRTFGAPSFENLYEQWRQDRHAVVVDYAAPATRFDTHRLNCAYAWLSPVRFEERNNDHVSHSSPD